MRTTQWKLETPTGRQSILPATGLLLVLATLAIAWRFCNPLPRSSVEAANQRQTGVSEAAFAEQQWPNLFGPRFDSSVPRLEPVPCWDETGPAKLWSAPVGTGYSSPVIEDGRLIVLHRMKKQEHVTCFAAETGTIEWSFAYPTAFQCRVEYSDGPYSTPVIDDGQVFALGAEGLLHALSFRDGAVLWSRDLSTDFDAPHQVFPVGTSPLLEGQFVIVAVGGERNDSGVVALDRDTGATVWTASTDRRGFATPVAATIHGERHVVVHTNDALLSLDPADGRVRWRIPFRPKNPDILVATTPVVSGDLILASAYQLGAMCVRVLPDDRFELLWTDRRSLDSQHTNLICRDGRVIGYSAREHALGAIDLTTGAWHWKWKSELDRGCLLSVSGQLLLFSETGRLALVTPREQDCVLHAISRPLLSSPCFSAPAICAGRLFLRNESELVCFDLRNSAPVTSAEYVP